MFMRTETKSPKEYSHYYLTESNKHKLESFVKSSDPKIGRHGKIRKENLQTNKMLEQTKSIQRQKSKQKILKKHRRTPPLRGLIKSQKLLPYLPAQKESSVVRIPRRDKLQRFDMVQQLKFQMKKLEKFHIQERDRLISIIEELNKGKGIIKNQLKQIEDLKAQISRIKQNNCQILNQNKQCIRLMELKHVHERQKLVSEIEYLKKRLAKLSCNKIKIDHIYTHSHYDKNKNVVDNKIVEIDQQYQISLIKKSQSSINDEYYNKRSRRFEHPRRVYDSLKNRDRDQAEQANTSHDSEVSHLEDQSIQSIVRQHA